MSIWEVQLPPSGVPHDHLGDPIWGIWETPLGYLGIPIDHLGGPTCASGIPFDLGRVIDRVRSETGFKIEGQAWVKKSNNLLTRKLLGRKPLGVAPNMFNIKEFILKKFGF